MTIEKRSRLGGSRCDRASADLEVNPLVNEI